jgi:hypothetical protein
VERVGNNAALPPDILRPAAIASGIVFGAVTDAKQRPGFPPDASLQKHFFMAFARSRSQF